MVVGVPTPERMTILFPLISMPLLGSLCFASRRIRFGSGMTT